MKKTVFNKWIKEVVTWGWKKLLNFHSFLKKKPVFEDLNQSSNKNHTPLKVSEQVEMSILSSERVPLSSEMEDWIKTINENSKQRFLSGELFPSLIQEVEKTAAVIQCTIEQGIEEKEQHLVALYPRREK